MYNLTSVNQAQWQALIDAIRQGGGGGGSTASSVSYDNTTSQLTATTVQGAIDEVSSDLDTAIEDINTNTQAINELNSKLNNKQDKLVSTNIASKVSVISGCTLMGARQYGNTVTISILVTRNIKDQTNVATISNDIKPAFVVAASVFYYNGEDMARAVSGYIAGATIQYRCLTQTTGSSGVLPTFTYVI